MKNLSKIIKNKENTFFKTSFRSFFIIAIAITIILTAALSLVYAKYIAGTVNKFTDRLLAQSSYSVTYINELSERLANTLYNDNDITAFLNMNEVDNLISIRSLKTMDKQINLLDCIDSIYLCNLKIDCWMSSTDGNLSNKNNFFDQDMVRMLGDNDFIKNYDGKPIARNNKNSGDKPNVCSYILFRHSLGESNPTDVLVINIKTSTLTESISTIQSFSDDINMNFVVMDGSRNIISDSISSTPLSLNSKPFSAFLDGIIKGRNENLDSTYKIGNTSYITAHQKMPSSDWYVVGLVDQTILYKDILTATIWVLSIVIIFLIVFMGVSAFLAKKLSSPIQAITDTLQGKAQTHVKSNIVEVEYIDSIFNSMKEQTKQYESFKKDASYTMKQNFLMELTSRSITSSTEHMKKTLDSLNLSFIHANQLCLCIYKIDDYSEFESNNNEKERLAMRFSIGNIITEISGQSFAVETFNYEKDKIVLILDTSKYPEYDKFKQVREAVIRETIECVDTALNVSLSCAYSPIFQGINHLPIVCENTRDLLVLVLKRGYKSIIEPNSMEEFNFENIGELDELKSKLIDQVSLGSCGSSIKTYQEIADKMVSFSCNDIMFFLQNLHYSIYLKLQNQWPSINQEIAAKYKQFVLNFENASKIETINQLFISYLTDMCDQITNLKNLALVETSNKIVENIIAIIHEDYTNQDLCTNSIADKTELTANYMGHLFRSRVGKSISKYILELRLAKVAELLTNTNLSLDDILDQCGLEKNNYFYTCFKKHFGLSLMEFKQKSGSN